jgi:uncharacterized Zn finger protein
MARRRWDDPWQRFPESVPLPAPDGLATSKQRGAMAATWWSRRFLDVLESYGLGTRMQRGRRYARTGQLLTLDVRAGMFLAQVQGSRRTPYVVTIATELPTAEQWAKVDAVLASRVGFVARLLAGEVSPDLEAVFRDASVELFPSTWSRLDARCTCPDWENPCKHIAAVLYVFADQLDDDPWLLLAWRGRTRDELLEPVRARAGRAAPVPDTPTVAPWWPLGEGTRFAERGADPNPPPSEPPDPAEAVLRRLAPLEVDVRGTSVVDLVAAAYAVVVPRDSAADPLERGG